LPSVGDPKRGFFINGKRKENTMTKFEIENCEKCGIARQYADNEEVYNDFEEENYEEIKEWFRQRAKEFEFHPIMHWCSMCGERKAHYNGITLAISELDLIYNGVIFQFCKICRDELQMIKLQTIATQERIGA
jgi:hypothetical protein